MQAEISLKVDGMTCNNCAAGITKSLKDIGFKDADANFIDGEVSFSVVEGKTTEEAVSKIESLGYSIVSEQVGTKGWNNPLERKFIIALLFSFPLFMHMFVPMDWWLNDPIVQIALCLPVYYIGFIHFGKSAWGSLKAGLANMDVLIFIGSTSAFVYSLVGTYMFWGSEEMHNYMFFETTATIITLVLLGNVIEHRAVSQTAKSLGELSKMKAEKARIVMQVGSRTSFYEAEPSVVKLGDILQVNEGEAIPVDGILSSGRAMVNEASITGESDLVEKAPGSTVFSGTLVQSGNFQMQTTALAKDSTLQQIIDLVKKARKEQPKIQVLGDRVSGIFVPVVIGISVLTFILAYFAFSLSLTAALMNSVAVLVISCPCAMGLATPTAVVSGVGRAARMGVIIKGGNTLETLAGSKTIIFDKTGTITSGRFQVKFLKNNLGERAKQVIKAMELQSSHPIAKSLSAAFADSEAEDLSEIVELKGEGMSAISKSGERIFFGKNKNPEQGDLILQIDGKIEAILNIGDEVLQGAEAMVKEFKKEGFRTVLLSGDRAEKVIKLGENLGFDEIYGGVSPDEKLKFIEGASAKGQVVMVGDGINDGPALSRADVGISPKGASALAINSARVVVLNPDSMEGITAAYKVSKHTYLTIKQNLFWAFSYNVVAIPIAAFGFLNPMVAALAMAFSDVVVIGNSIRLRYKKLK